MMRFATASEPADPTALSEDWVMAAGNIVVVLDGATARTDTGCVHGVTWFVQQLGQAIVGRAEKRDTPLNHAIADAIRHVAASHPKCDLTHPGTPSAAVGVLRMTSGLEYFVLGDVSVVLDTAAGIRLITDDRVSLTAAAERAEADRYPIGSPDKHAALLRMKHGELAARNRPDGYWVAETNPNAVDYALIGRFIISEVGRCAVLTDGAARAVAFGLHDWSSALNLMEHLGPRELIRQVRAAELQDPVGRKWPRNKRSDDATAVFGLL